MPMEIRWMEMLKHDPIKPLMESETWRQMRYLVQANEMTREQNTIEKAYEYIFAASRRRGISAAFLPTNTLHLYRCNPVIMGNTQYLQNSQADL